MPTRFPFKPLQAAIDKSAKRHLSLPELALSIGITDRSIHRYFHAGLEAYRADSLAIRAGFHPSDIWGEAWWESANED